MTTKAKIYPFPSVNHQATANHFSVCGKLTIIEDKFILCLSEDFEAGLLERAHNIGKIMWDLLWGERRFLRDELLRRGNLLDLVPELIRMGCLPLLLNDLQKICAFEE